jgi:hypothetical protein
VPVVHRGVAAQRRRGDDPATYRAEPPCDQAGVRQIRDAYCNVNAARDEVDHLVVELEIDGDLGVGREEVGQSRRDVTEPE